MHALASLSGGRVVLIDLPSSLQAAQNSARRVRSCTPLADPYPSTEPKGTKLARVLDGKDQRQLDRERLLEAELSHALAVLGAHLQHSGVPWCLPRLLADLNCDQLSTQPPSVQYSRTATAVPVVLSPLEWGNTFSLLSDIEGSVVANPSLHNTIICVLGVRYIVPSQSSFVHGSIQQGLPALGQTVARFDLVLMDPPWDNRSVRRAAAYHTSESQDEDPFIQTLPVLRRALADNGLLAIWVTNKARVRAQVIEALRNLCFELRGEWTWLKVTSSGAPVTSLDGVWRKPYESLLLFLRRTDPRSVPTRTIVAVPDFHSRKPSLKCLLEELLPMDYAALELFARGLTAGWMSWGLEVLKYQDMSLWE